MSSSDLHEFVMRWPHTDANEVLVTGTFDQWSSSVRLERTPTGFEGPVRIPYGEKIQYKFIVDGMWVTDEAAPSEADGGFVNNVYTAPAKPAPAAEPTAAAGAETVADPSAAIEPVSEPAAEPAAQVAPEPVAEPAPEPVAEPTPEPITNGSVVSAAKDFAEQTLPAHDAETPAADEESKTLLDSVKDTTTPVTAAVSEFAEQLNGGIEAPTPAAAEPTKTMFDYVKGAVASFVPSISPRSTSPSAPASPPPMPAPEPAPEVKDAPNVSIGILAVASTEEPATSTAEPTVVPGTAVVAAGEDVPPVGSTHIPLPPANVPKVVEAALPAVEVAPVQIEKVETPKDEPTPELAPSVLAAEPVSDTKDEPKESTPAPVSTDVTAGGLVSSSNSNWAAMMAAAMPKAKPVADAAPVAAVPTAAAVNTAQETSPEVVVSEDKATAPEVLAAPPAESVNKEVAPVEDLKPVEEAKPTEEVKTAEEVKASEPTAAEAVAPVTPKKETSSAPTTPGSNGKPTTTRSGTLRGLKFPGHRRHSSGDVTPEKSRSVSESVKDSSRKKRLSIFGKVKEAFHKDKAPGKA